MDTRRNALQRAVGLAAFAIWPRLEEVRFQPNAEDKRYLALIRAFVSEGVELPNLSLLRGSVGVDHCSRFQLGSVIAGRQRSPRQEQGRAKALRGRLRSIRQGYLSEPMKRHYQLVMDRIQRSAEAA